MRWATPTRQRRLERHGRLHVSVGVEPVFDEAHATNITSGPDGNLWFTDYVENQGHGNFATITPSGIITEYPATDFPDSPFFTPDGNLWFVDTANQIGRKVPDGTMTYFAPPTPHSSPWSIVLAPDGKMWFTESGGQKIGRLNL